MVIKLRKRTDEEIKESDDYTRKVQHAFTVAQHNEYLKSKTKAKKANKKETKGDIKKLFKEVKATKMPSAFDPEIEAMKEKLKEISSLMSKPKQKMTKRVLTAKSDHKRNVSNVSSVVKQYVDEYKYILDNVSTKGGAQTKKIAKIRSKLYESAMPSEINDANTLIRELKKDYVKEPKPKVVKAKVGSADDLHKKVVKYVKDQIKKGPLETMGIEPEDIGYIADEAISKGLPPRMSVKFIKSILDELY